jgi:hypothetical protein
VPSPTTTTPPGLEANPLSSVIQLSPVQYGNYNTLVMTESFVTALASQYKSRRKRWRCCPCAVPPQIRCKTISVVKLSQFTYLEAYVDLREGVSAMLESVRNDDTLNDVGGGWKS